MRILSNYKTIQKYSTFILLRFLSFLIIGFSTFLGPKIVGLELFGEIEYEIQLIGLSTVLLFGAHSGFGFRYFNNLNPNISNYISTGLLHSIIIYIILSLSLHNDLMSFGISCLVFSVILEQLFKINNQFNLAIIYKPLTSVFIVVWYLFFYFYVESVSLSTRLIINIIYFSSILVFIAFFIKKTKTGINLKIPNPKEYFNNLKSGFEPNLTTSLVLIFFFLDRYFIKEYYTESLGVYSIAFNFSLISFLLLSSIGYVTTIKIGERLKNKIDIADYIRNTIKWAYFICITLIIIVVTLIYIVSKYWFDIPFFEEISIINVLGKSFFGATALFSPVIFYLKKERYQWIVLLFLVLVLFLVGYFFHQKIDFIQLQIISNLLLFLYSIYILLFTKILTHDK